MGVPIQVEVNGQTYQREVEPRTLLVHFLREELGLTGTNVGCETSLCGACTVLVDGGVGEVVHPACGAGRRRPGHHHRRPGQRQ